jgi:putative salt-induced outer membrane protein YdiY
MRIRVERVLTAGLMIVLAGGGPAQGQDAAAPPVREGSAEVSFVGTTGNASTSSLGAGGSITFRPTDWEFAGRTAYLRTRSAAVLTAEAFDTTVRADRRLTPRVSAFGRYGHLRDRFAGIAHRHGLDGGVAVRLVASGRQELTVSGGAGYSSEQRVVAPDVSTAVAPLGALYTLDVSETTRLSNDFALVASLEDGSDRRITNVAALTSRLLTGLSLKVSHTARHLSRPAPNAESLDTITAIALVATF